MSDFNVLLDNLDRCTKKFHELILLKKNEASDFKDKENEIEEIFSDIEKNLPHEIPDYIERMHMSKEGEETEIIQDFRQLESQKRNILLKMMELVWKMGLFEDESDVDKRERWYNLLKSNC